MSDSSFSSAGFDTPSQSTSDSSSSYAGIDTPSFSTSDSSYILPPHPSSAAAQSHESHSDVDSLPSSPTTSTSSTASDYDGDRRHSDAEREWRESLQQLELLLTMVLVPYLGKYFGRKCAYWGWAKFMQWKYPVEVVVTSQAAFKGSGAVAAATL